MGQKRQRAQGLVHHAVDVVVGAEPPLLLHHLPLARQRAVDDDQRRHPIRFQIEDQRQRLGGEILVVRSEIMRGVRVGGPPRCFEAAVELLRSVLLRSVEHHVLEEVRDACDARALVARADPEEAVEGADRQGVVPKEPDLEAVLQAALLDGKVLLGERHQSSPGGSRGFIMSCSAGVISFLRLLHSLHAATTFPFALRPPRATGTTWSMVRSRGGTFLPHQAQSSRWTRRCHHAVLRRDRAFSRSLATWAGSTANSNHSSVMRKAL